MKEREDRVGEFKVGSTQGPARSERRDDVLAGLLRMQLGSLGEEVSELSPGGSLCDSDGEECECGATFPGKFVSDAPPRHLHA